MKITVLYGPTCIPCKILDQRINGILKDHPEIEYEHLNALEHSEYNVQGTPYVIITNNNEELYNGHPSNILEVINIINDNL